MAFDFDTTADDIRVFLDEAEEQLQIMEVDILRLEKEGEDPEVLQEIFRAAHTLKGSSATLGHKKMAEVTHYMENVLDKLRKGKLTVTTEVVDTLFACLDVLKGFKDEIAAGEEAGIEIGDVLARLTALDGGPAPTSAGSSAKSVASARPAGLPGAMPTLHPGDEAKLRAALAKGQTVFFAQVALDKNSAMPAVRAFQALLAVGDVGELIRSWPTQEEVEEDKVSDELKLLFATTQSADAVRKVFDSIPELKLSELTPLGDPVAAAPQAPQPVQAQAAAAVLAPEPSTDIRELDRAVGPVAKTQTARTVRVDVEVLDNLMSLVGELVIDRTRLLQVLTRLEVEREGDELVQIMSSAITHVGRMTSDLQEEIQRARMLPVDNLFRKFPRMVRDTAQKAVKEVEFVIRGEETELDRSVIEEIGDPLMHLLRNAVDHGVEPPMERVQKGKPAKGTITLEAFHEENHIIISIRDDGRGMDPAKIKASAVRKGLLAEEAARRMSDSEAINLIWAPGFSTAEKVSDISGRGVGLDVVHKNIEKLNGYVDVRTEIGKGTEFRIKLPLTLAIIRSLQVQVQDATYCIPLGSVVETDRIPVNQIKTVRQREVILKRGEVIPLVRLVDVFQMERPAGFEEPEEMFVVIVAVMGKQIGIVVDTLVGEGDVVIKPLGKFIGDVPGVSGATIMGDGDVAIILDIGSLIASVQADNGRSAAGA